MNEKWQPNQWLKFDYLNDNLNTTLFKLINNMLYIDNGNWIKDKDGELLKFLKEALINQNTITSITILLSKDGEFLKLIKKMVEDNILDTKDQENIKKYVENYIKTNPDISKDILENVLLQVQKLLDKKVNSLKFDDIEYKDLDPASYKLTTNGNGGKLLTTYQLADLVKDANGSVTTRYYSYNDIHNDLNAKADKTDLDKKADKTDLDKKADKTDLDKKADKTDLDKKADKTDLDKKADIDIYDKYIEIKIDDVKCTPKNSSLLSQFAFFNNPNNLTFNEKILTINSDPINGVNKYSQLWYLRYDGEIVNENSTSTFFIPEYIYLKFDK